jgi:plasmid stabilization system protein ParE
MIVSFHKLAERELNEAADAIFQNPEAGPIIRGTVRRRLCRRFPYALLYTIREDRIRILAVMNMKRRPAYWVGRS